MPGDVQIDMSNTYYKSNAPIPVSIEVTGPDNGLFIELLKENLVKIINKIRKQKKDENFHIKNKKNSIKET